MFDITFRMNRRRNGAVVLSFGIAFRIVFAALVIVFGWGIADRMVNGEPLPILSVVLLVVVLLGALYEERWIFDPSSQTVSNRQGLIVLSRRRSWNFHEIDSIEYTTYRVGSNPRTASEDSGNHGDDGGRRSRGGEEDGTAPGRFGNLDALSRRRFFRYSIILTDGSSIRIELRRVRRWPEEKRIAEEIARTLGVPLSFTSL